MNLGLEKCVSLGFFNAFWCFLLSLLGGCLLHRLGDQRIIVGLVLDLLELLAAGCRRCRISHRFRGRLGPEKTQDVDQQGLWASVSARAAFFLRPSLMTA